MIPASPCFHLGVVTGLAISFVIAAVFGWVFILIAENDWKGVGRTDR